MSDESNEDDLGRRDFLRISGTASVAAASWLALTQKTDALAQNQTARMLGDGSTNPNSYEYDHPD